MSGDTYRSLVEEVVQTENRPCSFDHHGSCQEHPGGESEAGCWVARAKALLASDRGSYPFEDWQYEVANANTALGYDDWVTHQVELGHPPGRTKHTARNSIPRRSS